MFGVRWPRNGCIGFEKVFRTNPQDLCHDKIKLQTLVDIQSFASSEQLCVGASLLRSARSDSHLIMESYLCIIATDML